MKLPMFVFVWKARDLLHLYNGRPGRRLEQCIVKLPLLAALDPEERACVTWRWRFTHTPAPS